jgi:predicted acetyltransferase/ubiquinone/menaquinone biosynthesis C-methylase UbiE
MNGSGGLEKFDDPGKWIDRCRLFEKRETLPNPDFVETEQFMLDRKDDGKVLGMISFRHSLNEYLAEYGGHVGYSVRPSERRKGYAGRMLAMCLERCIRFGLEKVLITCMAGNEASRKTILRAGGIYERTTRLEQENVDMERYWITLDPLKVHYSSRDEDGRLQSRYGRVEFLTSMRYIERYLEPQMRILDIGAGTGRYSLALADMGSDVDAVELLEHNIGIFKTRIKPEHKITLRQGNALDLSFIPDNSHDITLLFGPLYHLYNFADKRRALSEAFRVTKPGGVIFIAYCIQDASIIQYGFQGEHMEEIFEKKLLDPETFKVISDPGEIFELHRKEDIDALMEGIAAGNNRAGRLHYVATDLFTNYIRPTFVAMDDAVYEIYLKYHFSICERPDMVGLTNHSLDIWRKL